MKILIGIAHTFNPKTASVYSSQDIEKKGLKEKALYEATIGNLTRHNREQWIHASLGKGKEIVTRKVITNLEQEIEIRLYAAKDANLVSSLPDHENLQIIEVEVEDKMNIPMMATEDLLKNAEGYDLVCYLEDDITIEDPDFFQKLKCMHRDIPNEYALLPHRCEYMDELGEVMLSGDPDGGRKDLFWDTKEKIYYKWPTGTITFYRATNPHSGCFFLSKEQVKMVVKYWEGINWKSSFRLSGPLEQAASGRLLNVLKVMKPIPEDYKFFKVMHRDTLWKRHRFE